MEITIIILIAFWLLAIVFRWAWNLFLRDVCIIMLPPSDHPNAEKMEELFRAYDGAFGDKKRK